MRNLLIDKHVQREVLRPQAIQSQARVPRSWVWLIPAAVLLLFANGASNIPLAAWLAPLFLLRFVRTQKAWIGLPIAYLAMATAFAFQFRGMVPIPGIGYYVFLSVFGLALVLPYVIDRLVTPRLDGVLTTLVFPTAFVSMEYLVSRGPYGSWGSIAYTQYGNLALLQLLSVTGLWGLTFLMCWFVALINWMWAEGLKSKRVRAGMAAFASLLLAIILGGEARLVLYPSSAQTTRVASLSRTVIKPEASGAAWDHLLQNKASNEEAEEIRRWNNAVNNDLLARAEREAQAGAKIVFWGEGNAGVFKDDEAMLLQRGGELASKYKIYLGMALATWNRDRTPSLENKLVLIEPTGQVAWESFKARPIPGGEAEISIAGDGKLRSLDTPYGRVSSIICFDADFPQLLAQAGAMQTDVMLDPSNDWRAIDPWHTQMASFRAIEQGFNLIRHTDNGLSATFDYQGKRLAAMDHFQAADHVMISQVPTKGVRTIYSLVGDWFAWLCLAAALLLTAKGVGLLRFFASRHDGQKNH
jgi:apolipoprotein N-acyltransferase